MPTDTTPQRGKGRTGCPYSGSLQAQSLAAVCAWGLSLRLRLNPLFPVIPVGDYVIGVAVAFFAIERGMPPEQRLFVIMGFLGALGALGAVGTHLIGSFGARALGVLSTRWLP